MSATTTEKTDNREELAGIAADLDRYEEIASDIMGLSAEGLGSLIYHCSSKGFLQPDAATEYLHRLAALYHQ